MIDMKVLIGIPSPRDIPEFRDNMGWILEDQIWVKYYDEYTAYKYIRKYFLMHPRYTHLCIIPDDLIVKREQYYKLKDRVQENDFQVFSGVFNRDYNHPEELTHYPIGDDIQQVESEGFGCCFIRRDVVEKIPFDAMLSFDVRFSRDCKELGIPIFVDTSVILLHLACRLGGEWESMGIGYFTPQIGYLRFGTG